MIRLLLRIKRFLASTTGSEQAAPPPQGAEQSAEEIKKNQIETENLLLVQKKLLADVSDLKWGWWFNLSKVFAGLSGLAGIAALIISCGSLWVTYQLSLDQRKKWNADKTLDEDRFVRETLEKVADPKAPVTSRIAFISSLNLYWVARQAPALASEFIAIIRNEPESQVTWASADGLSHAVECAVMDSDKEAVRMVLFGRAAGQYPKSNTATPIMSNERGTIGAVVKALTLSASVHYLF
jgi:hypothetical protein